MSIALALLASFGAADAQTTIPAQERYAQVAAQLQRLAEHEVSEKNLPGLSLALIEDQQFVWAQGFGFADPDKKIAANAETVYRWDRSPSSSRILRSCNWSSAVNSTLIRR